MRKGPGRKSIQNVHIDKKRADKVLFQSSYPFLRIRPLTKLERKAAQGQLTVKGSASLARF